ncbi:MAG: hypothetical protein ACFFE4_19935 [Candidatus Thorarchaeota archaeon]
MKLKPIISLVKNLWHLFKLIPTFIAVISRTNISFMTGWTYNTLSYALFIFFNCLDDAFKGIRIMLFWA